MTALRGLSTANTSARAVGHCSDARNMEARGLPQQHGKKQIRLNAEDYLGQAAARGRLPGGHREGFHHDVGIRALGVRVRMMAVVFAHPPAITQADAEIAEENAEDVADPP